MKNVGSNIQLKDECTHTGAINKNKNKNKTKNKKKQAGWIFPKPQKNIKQKHVTLIQLLTLKQMFFSAGNNHIKYKFRSVKKSIGPFLCRHFDSGVTNIIDNGSVVFKCSGNSWRSDSAHNTTQSKRTVKWLSTLISVFIDTCALLCHDKMSQWKRPITPKETVENDTAQKQDCLQFGKVQVKTTVH